MLLRLGLALCAAHGIAEIPWAHDFIVKYHLPDGGWNCDEKSSVSSIVSTVPVLEWLVDQSGLGVVFDRGMTYLVERGLFRSKRTGAVIDEAWLEPSMPRFYEYDVLRGLRLVKRSGLPLPRAALERLQASNVRCWPLSEQARASDGVASSFPLLDALSRPEVARPLIEAELAALG